MALVTNIAATPQGGLYSRTTMAAFSRPDNVTPYGGSKFVSDDIATAKALVFPGSGLSGTIDTMALVTDDNYTTDLRLLLFGEEPTNVMDNGGGSLSVADTAALLGVFTFSGSTDIGVAGIRWATQKVNQSVPYASPDGMLYGLLYISGAFTPTAEAWHSITLGITLDH